MNPYAASPAYETKTLDLRLVTLEDAPALLKCYSDPEAVAKMNADNCTSDFYFTSLEQMRGCILTWVAEYERGSYVRLAVLPKKEAEAIGTVEMFAADFPSAARMGVWRLDLASAYENSPIVSELTALAIGAFMPDFNAQTLVVKAGHTPCRAKVFETYGFAPADVFRPGQGYYAYQRKGIAYCGLACCLCAQSRTCPGCQTGGCDLHGECRHYHCCREKGLSGCWECTDFPCAGGMLDNKRIRAFAAFAGAYGADELVRRLMRNKADGIVYHRDGQCAGDYDQGQTQEALHQMIFGAK